MPITKSAQKALRQSVRRKKLNLVKKEAMKNAVKNARKIKSGEALSLAYKAIDKAVKKGVIKKMAAARKKSRLAKFLSAQAGLKK
jgi:small subunit ribosomal protein S20